jgi:hypothetical protein
MDKEAALYRAFIHWATTNFRASGRLGRFDQGPAKRPELAHPTPSAKDRFLVLLAHSQAILKDSKGEDPIRAIGGEGGYPWSVE